MGVRHCVSGAHDSRQHRHIRDLFENLVVHIRKTRFIGVSDRGNAHCAEGLHLPGGAPKRELSMADSFLASGSL
jgi:hypothetical protein